MFVTIKGSWDRTVSVDRTNCFTFIAISNSAEDILEEFFNLRLPFFDKRKKLILNKINENIKFISNQINFIKLVINSGTKEKIFKIKDIDSYLAKNKFDKQCLSNTNEGISKINKSYNYLTNLTFNQLTQNNLNKLENKLLDYKKEYKQLFNKTDKELWINDLLILQNVITNL